MGRGPETIAETTTGAGPVAGGAFELQIIVVIRSLIDACLMGSKFARSRAVLAPIAALCLASPVPIARAADITVWPVEHLCRAERHLRQYLCFYLACWPRKIRRE